MKTFFSFLTLLLVAATACTQTNVPDAVKTAFAKKFPAAAAAEWEAEDEGYEVEFKQNDARMSALFDARGTWQATETEMKTADLPAAVTSAIAAQFAGYTIQEAEQLSTPDWNGAYEVELKKTDSLIEAVFAANGQLLRQEADDEEEDDDGGC